ncbi:MAG: hypothetical protein AABX33_03365 [Nanoarchaeota archaeon]
MAFLSSLFRKSKKGVIEEHIAKNKIIVYLIPNKGYQNGLFNIVKSLAQRFNRILYVSVNRPAEILVEVVNEMGIDAQKFLFVDAVNKEVKGRSANSHFIYITSPKNFKEFEMELNKVLDNEKFECLIFDSLSTLLIYQDESTVTKFTHDITKRIIDGHSNCTLPCLLEDVNSALVKDIAMFVDKVVEVGEDKTQAKQDIFAKKDAMPKLEKEMKSIKNAYTSGLISEQAYLKARKRIEAKLLGLRKSMRPK